MVYNGVSNRLLGTDDLTKLSNNEIKSLDIGDTVILSANGEEQAFRVAKKTASEFSMIHTGKDKVVEVKYALEDGIWEYDSTTETAVGGTKAEANPTLIGNEPKLEGLKLDNDTFKVGATKTILASGTFSETAQEGYIEFDCSNITQYDMVIFTFQNLFFVFFMSSGYLDTYYLQSTAQRERGFGGIFCCQLAKTSSAGNTYRIRLYEYLYDINISAGDHAVYTKEFSMADFSGSYYIIGFKL